MDTPLLRRDIQMIPAQSQGRRMIAFLDPYRLTEGTIALDMRLLPILRLLDGTHTLQDIQRALMRQQGGTIVPLSEVESFLDGLDRAFLLQSPHFDEGMRALREAFTRLDRRYPVHAGKSYESDPDRLRHYIEDIEGVLPPEDRIGTGDHITGIVAPHIDITVARHTYINVYRTLRERSYDLVIIFGINHQMQQGLYALSEKDYVTPFGTIRTDRAFIARLREGLPEGTLAPDDFGHKMEHSIEFQTIFLHHYLGKSLTIVPILCGAIHEFLSDGKNICDDRRFRAMVDRMHMLIGEKEGDVLLVSGVDFSHVGPKFGHHTPAAALLPLAMSSDRTMLSHIGRGSTEDLFEHALTTQDRYNVCGLPALLICSQLLQGDRGTLLSYDSYDEAATDSAVTYASMIFSPSENRDSR